MSNLSQPFAGRRTITTSLTVPVLAASAAALAGWVLSVPAFTQLSIGNWLPKPNAALAFVLSAAALLAARKGMGGRARRSAAAVGFLVFLIGAATALEYVFGSDLGIDRVLIYNGSSLVGTRMSPHSAAGFVLLGASISCVFLKRMRRILCDPLAIAAIATGFTALLGHTFDSNSLYGGSGQAGNMAVVTAISFCLLGAAVVMMNRTSRVAGLMLSDTLGGVMARRLWPAAIVIPTVAGLLRITGRELGLYEARFSVAVGVLISVMLTCLLIYFFGRAVQLSEMRRREAEARLFENEKRFRLLVENGQGSISTHTLDGYLTSINPAGARIVGYTEEEMVGMNLRELIPVDYHSGLDGYLRQIANDGLSNGLLAMRHKNGHVLTFRFDTVLISEEGKDPYVLCHAQNVTELLEAQRKLKDLSLTDELTGLYNRRGFLTMAEHQLKLEKHRGTARGLMLLFGDMDGLKGINDNYGHSAGSKAIITLGRLLGSAVRSADLVARWGGDEFVVLSVGADREEAEMMVERMRERINEYNQASTEPYNISCSFGIAGIDSTRLLEDVIAEADAAMYAEKRKRKNERAAASALAIHSTPEGDRISTF